MVAGTVGTVGNVAATTVSAPINVLEGNKPLPVKKQSEELEMILDGDPAE